MGDEEKALGFFGGSFDPPHLGHLILARDAFDQLSLEKIFLVPARQSPLRSGSHAMAFEERLAMCRLLAQGRDWLEVLDIEGALPSPSYTVNTVRRLAEAFPGRKLVWLVGADQWEKLPKWKDWEILATLVSFAVAARPGHKVAKLPRPRPEFTVLKVREVDISSTEIREKLAAGRSVEHLVPREIAEYIDRRRLYGHH